MLTPINVIRSRLEATTQRQLAHELGISPSYLGDIVQGRRPPSDAVIKALGLEVLYRYRNRRTA